MLQYLIVMLMNELGGIDSLKSKGISEMYFTDYSEEISIGEALKATCSNCNWDSREGSNGLYYVTFSGNGANGSLLQIVFETDGNTCSVESISMDGEDITLLQGLVFEMLFENASGGNAGDWSSGLEQNTGLNEFEQENSYEEVTADDSGTISEETNTSEIVRTGTFYWQEGANEDAFGAEVTIGYDENNELRIVGPINEVKYKVSCIDLCKDLLEDIRTFEMDKIDTTYLKQIKVYAFGELEELKKQMLDYKVMEKILNSKENVGIPEEKGIKNKFLNCYSEYNKDNKTIKKELLECVFDIKQAGNWSFWVEDSFEN